MNGKSFFEYMKAYDKRYLKIIMGTIIVLMALCSIFFRVEKIRNSQVKQHIDQVQILQKANAVKMEYDRNKEALESGNLKRALEKDKVEIYQAKILQMLENQHVRIENITALKQSKKENEVSTSLDYESTWIGKWNDVMNVLKMIDTEPVAINYRSIKIEAGDDPEIIKATVKYKIYIVE